MKNKIWQRFKINLLFYAILGIIIALLKSINTFYFQELLDSYNSKFNPLSLLMYGITIVLVPILS